MTVSRFLVCAMLLLATVTSMVRGQAPPPYRVLEGVPYTSHESVPLAADLYLPAGKGPFPAIIFVHGGGWWSGTRKQLQRQAQDFASAGIFGMAIDYRLAPAVHFPVPQDDLKTAIIWLRAHAKEYNIDPSRVALVGSSAGAHMALLHVLTNDDADADVSAVIAFNAVLDLTDEEHEEAMVTRYLGVPCANNLDLCRRASPLFLAGQSGRLKPRILLLHGTEDKTVPYRQAERTLAALKQVDAQVSLYTAPGAGHTFWVKPGWYEKSFTEANDFLGWGRPSLQPADKFIPQP